AAMTSSPRNLADRPATPAASLRPPHEFTDPPALEDAAIGLDADGRTHDLLSELLRSVRLSGERIVAFAPPRAFSIGFPQASRLLGSLPAVIILRGAGGPTLEGLEVARRMAVIEMQSPSQGSEVMVARILDMIFIQIMRIWAAGAEAEPNWLAGAFDPQI